MPKFKSLEARLADQAKAREKQAEWARKYISKPIGRKKPPVKTKVASVPTPPPLARPLRPWAKVRAGIAPLTYQSRATNEIVVPQPWAKELASILLAAADQGGVTLCLVWPAKLTALPLLHALANMERLFAKDLYGLRTLLYPGTHACRAPLHSVLANREALSAFYRTLWVQQENGSFELEVCTSSTAFLAVLSALNDLTLHNPGAPNPALAELVPTFVFDPAKRTWATTISNPLERTLAKVERLALRQDLRQKVSLEWDIPDKAPSALMVLHHTATKESWRTALTAKALKASGRPEVLLLDATSAAVRTNYAAVKRIPDFLAFTKENGFSDVGAVIMTDDPKTFFILRAQLHSSKAAFTTKVWAAEAEDVLLSAHPVAADWHPDQRSNSNFSVSIVDQDASQLALAFQRLTAAAGSEESLAYQVLLEACMYVLRLSNMPAGYTDLTTASAEAGEDYSSQQNAWTPVRLRLIAALSSGALNRVRDAVERAIARAEQLIDDWNDSTPMASRMLADVRKHVMVGRKSIALVLPNNKYVLLANRFLKRKLGMDWGAAEGRIEWHTLSAVSKTLTSERKIKHFTFVGINADVLRILVTHPEIPHGTAVLVAYRQAESTLTTLTGMKEVDAFKAYRGRIGLLAQELERRLAEVPNPLLINKLREIPLTFKFEENGHNGQSGEQGYTKFELEGGGRAYASGWVYRHVPDEDPPFRRAAASAIQPGDFIFNMSDELRAKLESSLQLNNEGVSSVVDPARMLLRLYHDDVQRRCMLMFKSTKRSALAREIHAKMVELDPKAENCRPGRVYYWLALPAKDDTRPHASKDSKYFKVFCKALEISDEAAEQHWGFVRNARRVNQYLGRELVARYAEILFQPESAAIYRKVPGDIIWRLQQEALSCVYRVERVVPPPARLTTSNEGETSAHPE
jgi:hypothetical protein